jgi:imidazolonepropionase-like amidohydrolase
MSSPDFAWLIEHGEEIDREYPGKWIAVHEGKIVGVGETASEAAERARETDPQGEFILEAVDRNGDVIYGGV